MLCRNNRDVAKEAMFTIITENQQILDKRDQWISIQNGLYLVCLEHHPTASQIQACKSI